MSTSRSYRHRVFASWYPKLAAATDRAGFGERRAQMLAGLRGPVVEVGAGSGQNFEHYPTTVTRLVAVEPEPTLRAKARAAAPSAPVPVEVVAASAHELPFADASLDAIVACLMLCSVTDQAAVLAEFRRVLRPSGQLRFLEHVRSDNAYAALAQKSLDATLLWTALGAGCHCSRNTEAAIRAAGFDLDTCERFTFPERGLRRPTAPHVTGVAVRPT
ncbi:MAG TPA: methyltransferase domain-containing protein [Actinocrinis sp.]|uniref:class I SAM-dependent methyltransferase n=1 Tax=Actinocrinis sp. TaxID=1920516 RepID=UPI002DDD25AB|nr:methyltransferase domain-containing protein [Actinocrinis sp.]HEV3173138.1 methyltransferase domain-containing protein [Actinocrinis sp.]